MTTKILNMDTITEWRDEINACWDEMADLRSSEDLEGTMRTFSHWSARSGYMHAMLIRSGNKDAMNFRTKEVDYFHDEVERQFKMWSRIATVNQAEWETAR